MTRALFIAAFFIGALAILWIARIFLGADNLGLSVTFLIAIVYLVGTIELLQYRRASNTLLEALKSLNQPVEDLSAWLLTIDGSLQNSVRLRVEGNRQGLPAPIVTPYLVGLLVMLGLLGTFVGMVGTLKGAVVALEGTNELEAIRAGLAAPIEGLGLAFGTSVAGVAASAMLGLLSTISRRERLSASNQLDSLTPNYLSMFSASHQQQRAYDAIQAQADALPNLVGRLDELASQLESMSQRVGDTLLENQSEFQSTISGLYQDLNKSVDSSLKQSLVESAELLSASVKPMAESTLSKLSEAAAQTNEQLIQLNTAQIDASAKAADDNAKLILQQLDKGLEAQAESTKTIVSSLETQVESSNQSALANAQLIRDLLGNSLENTASLPKSSLIMFLSS